MSTRSVNSKTILNVSNTVPGGWDAYDSYKRTSSGANTPRDLRLKGVYTENMYDCVIQSKVSDVCYVRFGNPSGPFTQTLGTENLGGTPVPVNSALPYPDPYSLLGKLEERWKDSTFNVGVFAAEGKEALEMMHQRLVGLHAAAQALRRRQFGLALRNLTGQIPKGQSREALRKLDGRDLSGAWLELNLGWSPMIGDIYNATKDIGLQYLHNRVRASTYNFCSMQSAGSQDCWTVEGGHKKHVQIIVYCRRALPGDNTGVSPTPLVLPGKLLVYHLLQTGSYLLVSIWRIFMRLVRSRSNVWCTLPTRGRMAVHRS